MFIGKPGEKIKLNPRFHGMTFDGGNNQR